MVRLEKFQKYVVPCTFTTLPLSEVYVHFDRQQPEEGTTCPEYWDDIRKKGKIVTGNMHVFTYDAKQRLITQEALPQGEGHDGYVATHFFEEQEDSLLIGICDNLEHRVARFLIPKNGIVGRIRERRNPSLTHITFFEGNRTERVLRTERISE